MIGKKIFTLLTSYLLVYLDLCISLELFFLPFNMFKLWDIKLAGAQSAQNELFRLVNVRRQASSILHHKQFALNDNSSYTTWLILTKLFRNDP